MEVVSDMVFICEIGNFKDNLKITIEDDNLIVKLGKDNLFRTLSKRKEIVGFLNKKLDGLVEGIIEKRAGEEENLNLGC